MKPELPINEYGNKLFLKQIREDQGKNSNDRLQKPKFLAETNKGLIYQENKVAYNFFEDFQTVMKEIADA